MKIKKYIIMFFLLAVTFSFQIINVTAAENEHMVRIGLTRYFKSQDIITVKNTMLTCGYWSSEINGFYPCEVFSSRTGFVFEAFEKTCYVSDTVFSSYEEAAKIAKKCSNEGITAYPAILHADYWKVYVTGSTEDCIKAYNIGAGNFSLSIVTVRYRMLVSGTFGSFIIDVDDVRNYPMFEATSSNSKGDYVVKLGSMAYRGYIEIGRYTDNGVTAVNILPMEEYLYGVVPSEISYTWPVEAIKAQAVAARSYAAAQDIIGPLAHVSSGGYTIDDTTDYQAYGGYNSEKNSVSAAIDATKDEKLYYNGNVIKAYYFSTSGGSTEDAQSVWNVPIDYFRQVSDVTELSPAKKPWIVEYTAAKIKQILSGKNYDEIGIIRNISADITTESGRIYSLRIRASRGSLVLNKTEISSVLSLPSTKFKVVKYGDVPDEVYVQGSTQLTKMQISNAYILSGSSTESKKAGAIEQYVVIGADNLVNYPSKAPTDRNSYYFAGMGYGHGVGMSQSGAACLAEAGYDYKQILLHYYTGVEIR